MAKQRFINTKFWDDSWIITLDPSEKLLFLYLITNPLTNIAGAYEISLRRIAFDTGIDQETVKRLLARFESGGKIVYRNGWVLVVNFVKNQSNNPKVKLGIEEALNRCPDWIKDTVLNGIDSLSKDSKYLDSDSDSDLDSDSDPDGSSAAEEINSASPEKPKSSRKKKPKTTLPADFALTDKMRAWFAENCEGLDIEAEFKKFCNRCEANATEYADWAAGWRTQMLNAVEWKKDAAKKVIVAPAPTPLAQRNDFTNLQRPAMKHAGVVDDTPTRYDH